MFDSIKKKIRNFQIKRKLNKILVYGRYTIDDEGLVNSAGPIMIRVEKIKTIPVKFGKIEGDFKCANGKLETLENAPHFVSGNFNCSKNNIKSLKGSPRFVGDYFDCSYNELQNLEGCPEIILGHFGIHVNELTTLEHFPKKVGGNVLISANPIGEDITTLKPCEIHGYIVTGAMCALNETIIQNEDIVEKFRKDKVKEMKDSLEESLGKQDSKAKVLKV